MKSKHTVLMEAIGKSRQLYYTPENYKARVFAVWNSLMGLFDAFDDYQQEIPKQESVEKEKGDG